MRVFYKKVSRVILYYKDGEMHEAGRKISRLFIQGYDVTYSNPIIKKGKISKDRRKVIMEKIV